MAWLVCNEDGTESIFNKMPYRAGTQDTFGVQNWWCRRQDKGYWYGEVDDIDDYGNLVYSSHDAQNGVELPMGTIKMLLGKELTWEDEPYEIGDWEDNIAWYIDDENDSEYGMLGIEY